MPDHGHIFTAPAPRSLRAATDEIERRRLGNSSYCAMTDVGHIHSTSDPPSLVNAMQDLEAIGRELQCSICHELLVAAVRCKSPCLCLQLNRKDAG
jgi:hypothetical protein